MKVRFIAGAVACVGLALVASTWCDLVGGRDGRDTPGASMSAPLAAAIREARFAVWNGRGGSPDGEVDAEDVVTAGHPTQQYAATFGADGARVESRAGGWSLGLSLVAFGPEGDARPVGPAVRSASGRRVEYRRDGIVEWYENDDVALEHGFDIPDPPSGNSSNSSACIELALDCDTRLVVRGTADGDGVAFVDETGARRASYAKLVAFDAVGRTLPARIAADGRRLRILVDARGAAYPVTVDPVILNEAKLQPSAATALDYTGWSVAVDDDTAVVGTIGGGDAGVAYVFFWSATGWSQQAILVASDSGTSDSFGTSVSISGDTVVVGAPYKGVTGAAYVFVRSGEAWSQQAKLGPVGTDDLGHSVSVDGDTAVVGAPRDADSGSCGGAAFVFVRSGTSWSQEAKLLASDGAADEYFGSSVSISGETIVGAAQWDGTTEGAAYVFVRSGTAWSEQAKLLPSTPVADDGFGSAVCVRADTAIVGASRDDAAGPDVGAAYVFTRSGTAWSEQAKLMSSGAEPKFFGNAVSLSGDTAVIASNGDSSFEYHGGAIYVFVRTGGVWSPEAQLVSSDLFAMDDFGRSVAVSGDRVIVGAPSNADYGQMTGSAYAFERSGGTWSQTAKLMVLDTEYQDSFGYSVSVSGTTAVVGADGDDDQGANSGSAYVFERSGPLWLQQAKLLPADGAAGDSFGRAVAVDGNTVIVGAMDDDDNGVDSGSAYVFVRSGGLWSEHAKLLAMDGAASDQFGWAVALDVDTAIVGARADDDNGANSGSAYVFVRNVGSWSQQAKLLAADGEAGDVFGEVVSVRGDTVVVGASWDQQSGAQSGSAYVFARVGSTWSQEAKLVPDDCAAGDKFGCSVAIDGGVAVAGARGDDDSGDGAGAAYVFVRDGTVWSQVSKLLPADGEGGDSFGSSVAVSGDIVAVGAVYDRDNGDFSGSAYAFVRIGAGWVERAKFLSADGGQTDYFGRDIAVSGDTIVVGAHGSDSGATSSGAAYVFVLPPVATRFVILDPADGTVDDAVTVTVQVQDQYANVLTSYQGDVTLDVSGSATGGGLVDIVDGVGTREVCDTVTETVVLALVDSESSGLVVTSTQDVAFGCGAPYCVAFVVPPGDTRADIAVAPAVEVAIRDQYGNTCIDEIDLVTAGIGGGPPSGTLDGTLTVETAGGVAVFSDLSIDTVGAGYTLTADCGSLVGATSDAFSILQAPVTVLSATVASASQIDISWSNPSNAGFVGVAVFRCEGPAPAFVPSSGTAYVQGTKYIDAVCVYNGSASSFADTGLAEQTQCSYAAFAYADAASPVYSVGVYASATTVAGAAPTVEAVIPGDGADDVFVGTTVAITFSEPMDLAATQTAFSIDGGVTGTLAWSGTTLVFVPDGRLEEGTTYTVTVDISACDGAGVCLPQACTFSFDTESFGGMVGGGCRPGRHGARDVTWFPVFVAALALAMRRCVCGGRLARQRRSARGADVCPGRMRGVV